jgi:hypothetical protein
MASKQSECEKPKKPKKPYVKPEFIQVALRPEEAVLGGCKTAAAAGPNIGHICTYIANCSIPRS